MGDRTRRIAIGMAALLLLAHVALAGWAIQAQSPTFDEPFHIAGGWAALRHGDYDFQAAWHPPLAELIAVAPYLFRSQPPILDRNSRAYAERSYFVAADDFLHRNRVPADVLLHSARWALYLALFPVLAFVLYRFAESLHPGAGAWSLVLLALEPNLLAHATLVTTDFAAATFFFAAFVTLGNHLREPSPGRAALTGAAWAASLLSKYSNLTAGFGVLLLFFAARKRLAADLKILRLLGVTALACAGCFLLAYRFDSVACWIDGVRGMLMLANLGRPKFFLGAHSIEPIPAYYPILLAMKTGFPHLLLAAGGAWAILRARAEPIPRWIPTLAIGVPAVHLFFASTSSVQLGIRYVLQVYPFLIALGAVAAGRLAEGSGTRSVLRRAGLAAALLWAAIGLGRSAPWFIAHFNETAGGAQGSYRCFTDSNNDWGQGLPALGKYLERQGVRSIWLAYFGMGKPEFYGIRYVPIGMWRTSLHPGDPNAAPEKEPKQYFAVSGTHLMGTYWQQHDLLEWLRGRAPEAFLGGSIFLYDLTGDAAALARVEALSQLSAPEKAREVF